MDSTHVSSYFKESASAETVDVYDGPCTFKSVSFSSLLITVTPVVYVQIIDGSTDLFRVYGGSYPAYGGSPNVAIAPALGVRISESLKFSVPSGVSVGYVTIVYQ